MGSPFDSAQWGKRPKKDKVGTLPINMYDNYTIEIGGKVNFPSTVSEDSEQPESQDKDSGQDEYSSDSSDCSEADSDTEVEIKEKQIQGSLQFLKIARSGRTIRINPRYM